MSLFDHDYARPAALRDEAAMAERAARRYIALSHDIVKGGDGAFVEIGSTLQPELVARVRHDKQSAVSLARASSVLAGVLAMFADDVDTYNLEIDRLNARWETALRTDFGVDSLMLCVAGETDAQRATRRVFAVSAARSALLRQLTAEQRRHAQELDEAARRAAEMVRSGPDDEGTAVRLIASGYLAPASATQIYPLATVNLGRNLFEAAKFAPDSWQAPGQVKSIRAMVLAAREARELAGVLQQISGKWDGVLDALASSTTFDLKGPGALDAWFRSQSEIAGALADSKAAKLSSAGARADMLRKVGLASKLGKGLALAGIPSGAYELWDTKENWDEYDTLHRSTHLAEGGASILSGGAAIVVMAGATGPAAPLVLVGAGLVAGGLAIYNNWDSISSFTGTASKAAVKKVKDFNAWAEKGLDRGADAAVDRAKDLGKDLSSKADKAWDVVKVVTPW